MWSIHQERDYVLKNDLLEHFKKESKGFVNHFFQNNHIECNDYILFVCFFLFYSIPDIVSVLIAMCGVNSNIIITKEKIDVFFHYFDLNISEDKSLLKVMDNTRRAYTEYIKNIYINIVVMEKHMIKRHFIYICLIITLLSQHFIH